MGTNYYVRLNPCECCGRYNEYHIGKSSMGWCFSLHIEPNEGIKNLKDVCKLMEQGHIYNEYGDHISQATMYEIITYGDYDLIVGVFS